MRRGRRRRRPSANPRSAEVLQALAAVRRRLCGQHHAADGASRGTRRRRVAAGTPGAEHQNAAGGVAAGDDGGGAACNGHDARARPRPGGRCGAGRGHGWRRGGSTLGRSQGRDGLLQEGPHSQPFAFARGHHSSAARCNGRCLSCPVRGARPLAAGGAAGAPPVESLAFFPADKSAVFPSAQPLRTLCRLARAEPAAAHSGP
mmetsp:Transcript_107209/g.341508  ORF Transcript_107209/g.341508 Transcript_107209/m.341508 type:complete len:203 (-) Transcript_107209:182-790(-)